MKKKYGVLIGLVVLLVVAVFVNIRLNNASGEAAPEPVNASLDQTKGDAAVAGMDAKEYFEVFRTERQSQREEEVAYIDEIILNKDTDAETLADAQQQKLAIVGNMENEFTIESLVKAKGFEDVAVNINDGTVNVVIKAEEITSKQAAQILDIVYRTTGVDAENVKVYPSAR